MPFKRAFRMLAALAVAAAVLFAGPVPESGAGGLEWDFSRTEGALGWQAPGAEDVYLEGTVLALRGVKPLIISPPGLGAPASANVVQVRVKSPVYGAMVVGLVTETGEVLRKFADLDVSTSAEDHLIYVGDVVPEGSTIQRVLVQFPPTLGTAGAVEVDLVRIFEPATAELLAAWWRGFWDTGSIDIKVATVSNIDTPWFGPVNFIAALYVVGLLAAAGYIVLRARKRRPGTDLAGRALVAAFVAAGVIYAVRMDYNWLVSWGRDARAMSGKPVRERIENRFAIITPAFPAFLDFMDFIRDNVPEGETVRPAARPQGDTVSTLARYFLLPVRSGAGARFLWTFDDGVVYDPASRALRKDDEVVAAPVTPYARFAPGAVVYRVAGTEGDG